MTSVNPPHVTPQLTVLAHARVPSPGSETAQSRGIPRGLVHACDLREALTREWPTDAHFTAYEPLEIPVTNGAPGETMPVRHTRQAITEGIPARLNVLVGDVDGPGHQATPEWRTATEARLEASGLAWYATRNGYRVVELLPATYVIENAHDEGLWWEFYLGWREHLRESHGIEIDERCKDWTRIYRLPNVVRDGKPARSATRHIEAMPTFDTEQWRPPASMTAAPNTIRADAPDVDDRTIRALERAVAIAERIPASIEGHGGDEALFQCARELATQLGEDADAIEFVLAEVFNPRCLPAWPATKLAREAARAAATQATPEARFARRHEERIEAKRAEAANGTSWAHAPVVGSDERDELGRIVDWDAPIRPLRYLCQGLGIGWVGKCVGILGYAGVSKGLFLACLGLCAAAGKPFLGHEVKRTPVIYCDAETGEIVENRIKRLGLAMGINVGELARDGWFQFRHFAGNVQDSIGSLQEAAKRIDKGEGVLIALDSYSSMVGGDENASTYADPMWALGQMGQDCNAIVAVVMHDRKDKGDKLKGASNPLEGISGTNRLAAALVTAIRLTPSEDDEHVITVTSTRAPEKRFAPIRLEWVDTENGGIEARNEALATLTAGQLETVKSRQRDRDQAVKIAKSADRVESTLRNLDKLRVGMGTMKLRTAAGVSGSTWGDVQMELRRRGTVEGHTLPNDKVVYWRLTDNAALPAPKGLGGAGPLPVVGAVASRRVGHV